MLTGELKAAANKLAKEQAERAERERQRRAKEKALAERQRQRQAAREEEARQRRLDAAAAAAAEEERLAQELEENRGVSLHLQLSAAPADMAAAAARGIKRAADKLLLPPSAGASLLNQSASRNGAMLFEVAASNGGRTHAGVLEFTAPEGVVLLPPKVVNCLWGLPEDQQQVTQAHAAGSLHPPADPGTSSSSPRVSTSSSRCSGRVYVKYKLLPKGEYVRFQPELRSFHEVVGSDPQLLKASLEACLMGYCTLSEGDWVQVQHGGVDYNLRVLELQPAAAVSVIETDIAADVGPSIETEGYLRAQAEAAAREAERQRQAQEQAERQAAEVMAAEEAAAAAEQQRLADEAARRLQIKAAKSALLSPEVPSDSPEPHTSLLFRLPDGTKLSRRFRLDQAVQELFDYLDSEGAGGLWPDTYKLVLQYPRRVLEPADAASTTLQAAGFEAHSQQAVFVEHME